MTGKDKDNKEYLDKVAIETMKMYLDKQRPTSFADSMTVARVAYKQAIAMLYVRDTQLQKLAEEVNIVKKPEEK